MKAYKIMIITTPETKKEHESAAGGERQRKETALAILRRDGS